MEGCRLCPRECGAARSKGAGFCGAGEKLRAARIAPHFWEEPIISGTRGTGAVFFSGCSLKCVFCQNYSLSHKSLGREMADDSFINALQRLKEQGVHNFSLVNPTHYSAVLARIFNKWPAGIPVIYNSGGFDNLEGLQAAEAYADVYLPDFKLMDESRCGRYLGFEGYAMYAKRAVKEMLRQRPEPVYDENGLIISGVIIRHLVLPCNVDQSKKIIDWLWDNVPRQTPISIMSQYFPAGRAKDYPEINRCLTVREYEAVVDYFLSKGFINGYIQELSSQSPEYVPEFDFTGM